MLDALITPGTPIVIGHRGASAEAPENTLTAFELALQQGANALEMDVRVSGDGVPVVIHDATTGRTTDHDIAVEETAAAKLGVLDAGYRFAQRGGTGWPHRGRGICIPTLALVLERFPDATILLEIKAPYGQEAVRDVIVRHGAQRRVVPASNDHGSLAAFRDGRFRMSASRRDVTALYLRTLLGVPPKRLPYHAISVPPAKGIATLASPRFIGAATRAGVAVHFWTINATDQARQLWQLGATGIITDDPAVMVAVQRDIRSEASA